MNKYDLWIYKGPCYGLTHPASLAGRQSVDLPSGRRHHRPRSGFPGALRLGGPATHGRAAWGGRRDKLEVSPNLWAGVGLVRGGAGTALVGDGPTVAARVKEYAELGIDTFIFSGYPHLEESYRVAELLFPHLDVERPEQPKSQGYVSPFGEMVANDILPKAASQS